MAAKKEPKIVQITPQGAVLWDQPEAVQVVPASPFGRTVPVYREPPSPQRLAALRQKYAAQHWHKQLIRDNAAGRFMASLLDNDQNEPSLDTPLA